MAASVWKGWLSNICKQIWDLPEGGQIHNRSLNWGSGCVLHVIKHKNDKKFYYAFYKRKYCASLIRERVKSRLGGNTPLPPSNLSVLSNNSKDCA